MHYTDSDKVLYMCQYCSSFLVGYNPVYLLQTEAFSGTSCFRLKSKGDDAAQLANLHMHVRLRCPVLGRLLIP